jgi:hypothetical protein
LIIRAVASWERCNGLKQARREPALARGLREALGAERRLMRVLEQHRIPGHQRRHDGIHGGEVGIVPRSDHEGDAEGLAPDEATEAFLRAGVQVGQRLRGERDHGARALLEAANLARGVADRPPHLPGELRRDIVALGDERVDEGRERRRALLDRVGAPLALCRHGSGDCGVDLAFAGDGALDVGGAVNRGDGTNRLHAAS